MFHRQRSLRSHLGSCKIKVRSAREAQARDFAAARTLNAFLTQDFIALADPSYAGRRHVTVIEAARGAAARIDARFSDVAPEIRAGLHASMQQSLHGLGDYEAAIGEGRKALQAFASAGIENARAVDVRLELAYDYIELSHLQESAELLQAAAASIKAQHLDNSAIAVRYFYVQASADAEEHIKNLLARQTQRLGPTHPKTCHSAVAEARIFVYQRRFSEALPVATVAEACLAKALGPTHARTLSAQEVIADLYYQSEDYSKAAVAYQHISRAYTQELGPAASRTDKNRVNVGVALLYSGQTSAAEQELTAALQDAGAALAWTSPIMEHLRFHLADCQLDLQHTAGVAHLLEGLSADVLNQGEIEPDWDARLAYEAGRLALDSGDLMLALPKLETAASAFAAKHSEGHFAEPHVRALIEQARQSGRLPSVQSRPRAVSLSPSTRFRTPLPMGARCPQCGAALVSNWLDLIPSLEP